MITVNDLLELEKQDKLAGRIFSAKELSNEVYHAGPGLSSSVLKKFSLSPAHVYVAITERHEPTKAMKFGSMVHDFILLPDEFSSTYHTDDFALALCKADAKAPRSTNVYKNAVREWKLKNQGCEIVTQEDINICKSMHEAVCKHKVSSKLLSGGKSEQSIFWKDVKTGVLCKCKPDYLSDKYLVDLKTANSVAHEDFSKTSYTLGYHISLAFYQQGIKAVLGIEPPAILVALEKEPPYGVIVYPFGQDEIMHGHMLCGHFLKQYKQCVDSDNWSCYPEKAIELKFEPWMWKKEEQWMKQ